MVELVEVEDEAFETKQPGPEEDEDDYYTDTDSEISSDDDSPPIDESLTDRIAALKDIVPPTTRLAIHNTYSSISSSISSVLSFSGKALFVISTSALLLGVPYALAYGEEAQWVEMEKEQKLREAGGEIFSQGGTQEKLEKELSAKAAL